VLLGGQGRFVEVLRKARKQVAGRYNPLSHEPICRQALVTIANVTKRFGEAFFSRDGYYKYYIRIIKLGQEERLAGSI
jgi:hypothetical protein